MSEPRDLIERIREIFENMNIIVPGDDTDLFESGLLDSLMFVDLLVRLEEQTGITVTLENLEPDNFRSIRRIAWFVRANQPMRVSVAS